MQDDILLEDRVEDESAELERFEHFRFVADPGQSLMRIDKFLADRIQHASRTKYRLH